MQRLIWGISWYLVLATWAAWAAAQSTGVRFGGADHDASLPVEVVSEELSVDQTDGTAIFSGDVKVVQGAFRLSADTVRVEYSDDTKAENPISKLIAVGGVTLVNGSDAAEAQRGEYDVAAARLVLEGEVLLTQGASAISGEKLTVDMESGRGRFSGRVRTILNPGGSAQ